MMDFGGSGGRRLVAATLALLWSGWWRKEREGGGEGSGAGPVHWPCRANPHGATSLVAPLHVTRQARPRQRQGGAAPSRPASVAPLSCQPQWRDRGWRDQTGYAAQIKSIPG